MKKSMKKSMTIAGFFASVACSWVAGYLTAQQFTKPSAVSRNAVWIEFENIQHALDSAGKLGGALRGLTVCVGSGHKQTEGTWVPPHVRISGENGECGYSDPRQRPALLTISEHNTVANMTFANNVFYATGKP